MNNIVGIKDAANVTIIDKKTQKPVLYTDYATQFVNEWKHSSVYAKSKSTNAIRWDYDKQSTLKASFEVFTLQLLSLVVGSDFKKSTEAANIFKREVVTVDATSKATLTQGTPITGSLSIFLLNQDDNITQLDEQILGTPSTTENTYSIATGTALTFNATTAPVNTSFVCYYMVAPSTDTQTLTFSAEVFPESVEIYADTEYRDTNGSDRYTQIHYLNARPMGNFTLTLSASSITKLEISFDCLKDTKSGDIATYTII